MNKRSPAGRATRATTPPWALRTTPPTTPGLRARCKNFTTTTTTTKNNDNNNNNNNTTTNHNEKKKKKMINAIHTSY